MTTQAATLEAASPEGLIFLPGIEPFLATENPERVLGNMLFAIAAGRAPFKGFPLEFQEMYTLLIEEERRKRGIGARTLEAVGEV